MLEKVKKWVNSPFVWTRAFSVLAMIHFISISIDEMDLSTNSMDYYAAWIVWSIFLAASLIIKSLTEEKK